MPIGKTDRPDSVSAKVPSCWYGLGNCFLLCCIGRFSAKVLRYLIVLRSVSYVVSMFLLENKFALWCVLCLNMYDWMWAYIFWGWRTLCVMTSVIFYTLPTHTQNSRFVEPTHTAAEQREIRVARMYGERVVVCVGAGGGWWGGDDVLDMMGFV